MTATAYAPHHVMVGGVPLSGDAVSYDRISRFEGPMGMTVTKGRDRQNEDNLECAEFRGLTIARRFSDNLSASKYATKVRDDWQAMLEHVRTGAVSYVIFWVVDRALRRDDDMRDLVEACREGRALILQSGSNTVADPFNDEDVINLKMAGLQAELEVAKMSRRQRRAKADSRKHGTPHGGGKKFGYDPGMVVNEREAEVVRELVRRLMAGDTLASMVRWLEDENVPTARGGKWSTANLGTMLQRPHLAGLKMHGGKAIRKGTWVGIIDPGTHEAVVSILSDPSRRTSYTNANVYLLAGLAECAECGAKVRARPAYRGKSKAYQCTTGRHCHRSVERVDLVVTEAVLARLEDTDAAGVWENRDAVDEVAHLEAQRDAVVARRAEVAAQFAAGKITVETLAAVNGAVDDEAARVAEALGVARVAAKAPVAALDGLTGPRARDAWAEASLGQKRSAINTLGVVKLWGAAHGREPFDGERHVTIEWRKP